MCMSVHEGGFVGADSSRACFLCEIYWQPWVGTFSWINGPGSGSGRRLSGPRARNQDLPKFFHGTTLAKLPTRRTLSRLGRAELRRRFEEMLKHNVTKDAKFSRPSFRRAIESGDGRSSFRRPGSGPRSLGPGPAQSCCQSAGHAVFRYMLTPPHGAVIRSLKQNGVSLHDSKVHEDAEYSRILHLFSDFYCMFQIEEEEPTLSAPRTSTGNIPHDLGLMSALYCVVLATNARSFV